MPEASRARDEVDLPLLRSHVHGIEIPADETSVLTSPGRPGEAVCRVVNGDADLAATAVSVAAGAARNWGRRSPIERSEALRRAASLLDERCDSIAHDLTREEGKTLGEAVVETRRAADILRYAAAQAGQEPDGTTLPSGDPENLLVARREPVGPVAVITPWNFPIAIPAWKIAPALAFGNPVVWKPAEIVPLTSDHLLRALLDGGIDPDAVSMLYGAGSVIGPAITTDPAIKAVTFTGSNAVGNSLLASVGPLGKRLQLEMGGKNPAVVLADADLDQAAGAIARAAFSSAGQKCTATSRVIVEAGVAEQLVGKLAEAADAMTIGDPLDPATEVGPLASEVQAQRVREYVNSGLEEGRLATGRRPDDVPDGPFVAPAVFTDLPAASRLIHEEVFGPVVVVIAVDSPEAALAAANDTPFGLSASVFTRDLGQAMRFSRELEVGTVKVNQESTGNDPHLPFGGTGESSHGPAEQGKAAVEFFTRWKSVYVRGTV